ncbi:uncharacterized protein BX663DRAFT_569172 [Cokeromyces recurvatus]|uniref:uncharacterized protein n=1 Tax=Cokeromyces recurvatus TaxID=90255 RepID=UPI002220295C|nr:uncharacterized protein BX663DRAFT_569172 [Cokeromyces recurvatus]KAI7903088.1 hypothetical protein BX663DRAFT_569172 [Cokeromyces recurvatus]
MTLQPNINIKINNNNNYNYNDNIIHSDHRNTSINNKNDNDTGKEAKATSSSTLMTATDTVASSILAQSVKRSLSEISVGTVNTENALSSLFSTLYNLYKGEPIWLNQIQKMEATTLQNKVFNYCIDGLQNFSNLTVTQRSNLRVLLSGVINTIDKNYRDEVEKIIGGNKLKAILHQHTTSIDNNYPDKRWIKIKEKLRSYYTNNNIGAMNEIHKYVIREKSRIIGDDKQIAESFELKIFTIIDFIVDQYSAVQIKSGEHTSYATKIQHELNEFEYGTLDKGVMGRRIALLLTGKVLNDKNEEVDIESSSIEIKPACVTDDIERIQFNKNVRTSKCLLYQYLVHSGNNSNINNVMYSNSPGSSDDKHSNISDNQGSNNKNRNNKHIISMDVVGLNAFLYNVYQYEDMILAVKETESALFLPADEDDLEEFLMGTSIDQLLYYIKYISTTYRNLKKASKIFKRRRSTDRRSGLFYSGEAASPLNDFPVQTFYTPKR